MSYCTSLKLSLNPQVVSAPESPDLSAALRLGMPWSATHNMVFQLGKSALNPQILFKAAANTPTSVWTPVAMAMMKKIQLV